MTNKQCDRPVIVNYWPKPIPIRRFDWCAYFEDDDESGPFGWGASKEAAIKDLLAEVEAYD